MTECEFKVGDAWKCRHGQKAVIVAVTLTHPVSGKRLDYPVVAYHENSDVPRSFTIDGAFYAGSPHGYDLIEPWVDKPKPVEFWVNQYRHGYSPRHTSREEADRKAAPGRIRCFHMREVIDEKGDEL